MKGNFFPGWLLIFLSLAPMKSPAAENSRPNILWLIAEDFGQHLGCYGAREVSSPNLDALAKTGVRYTRFFTTAPVCSIASLDMVIHAMRPVSSRCKVESTSPTRRTLA